MGQSANRHSFDVAILGAGAAGLAAAQRLSLAGKSVILLEARDRIGGRIHSLRDPRFPLPVDPGAEFIHGRDSETFQLLRASNSAAYVADGEHWHFLNGWLTKLDDFWTELDKILGRLDRLGKKDMSFAEFVKRRCAGRSLAKARELAMSFVEGFDAARAEQISAKSLAKAEEASGEVPEGSESFRILGGYGSVIDALLAGAASDKLTLQLRSIVRVVRWKRGAVQITPEMPDETPRAVVRAK